MPHAKEKRSRALKRALIQWVFFSHCSYNNRTLQGASFLQCLAPILRALYPNRWGEEMQKHAGPFNTEPNVGCCVHGVVARMEQQRAQGEAVDAQAIVTTKQTLMGLLAGLGDPFTQGGVTFSLMAVCVSLSLLGHVWAPIAYAVLITAVMAFFAYRTFFFGYENGLSAVRDSLQEGWVQRVLQLSALMACIVLGAVAATLPLPLWPGAAQPVLARVLPLLCVLACYGLVRQNVSAQKLFLLVCTAGLGLYGAGAFYAPLQAASCAPQPLYAGQALLLALLYYLSISTWTTGIGFVTLYRPVVSGFFVGWILGDLAQGVTIGACIQLAYLGFIAGGGAMPADLAMAGVPGTALGMLLGLHPFACVPPAMLLGLLGRLIWSGRMRYNAVFAQRAEACACRGDARGIWRWNVWAPQALLLSVSLLLIPPLLYALRWLFALAAPHLSFLWPALYCAGQLLPCLGLGSGLCAVATRRTMVGFLMGYALCLLPHLQVWSVAALGFLCCLVLYGRGRRKAH